MKLIFLQRKVAALLDDQQSLRTQIQRAQEDIQQLEETNQRLRQQSDVSLRISVSLEPCQGAYTTKLVPE